MIIKLENNNFYVEINTIAAEIQKFVRKSDGKDIIWNGDKNVWGYHAPILFPFVDHCLGDFFIIEGKKCEYSRNHGFARELEWNCIKQDKESAVLELTQSDDTLYRFPYSFCVRTEYKLTEKGCSWKILVKNTDKKAFKFGIGTHPALSMNGNKAEDFVIEFEKKEPLTTVLCNAEGYLLADKTGKTLITKAYGEKNKGIIPVTSAGFGNGQLFTNITSGWVGLRNTKDGSIIKVQTKGFPYCMIWQNTKGNPQFVCIEPWFGLPDAENSDHIWENKIGLNKLDVGEEFSCEQDIWME